MRPAGTCREAAGSGAGRQAAKSSFTSRTFGLRYWPPMADPVTHDVTLDDIVAAAALLRGQVHLTPMLESRTAAAVVARATGVRLGSGGAAGRALSGTDDDAPRVFVKAEHLQLTGSFKPRGALNRIAALTAR